MWCGGREKRAKEVYVDVGGEGRGRGDAREGGLPGGVGGIGGGGDCWVGGLGGPGMRGSGGGGGAGGGDHNCLPGGTPRNLASPLG